MNDRGCGEKAPLERRDFLRMGLAAGGLTILLCHGRVGEYVLADHCPALP